jgi:shikimate dehydrogenase
VKRRFGLVGKSLSHSFSEKYFNEKFRNEGILSAKYDLFELKSIDEVVNIFSIPNLRGINVTIPYKQQIKAHLHYLDDSAGKVGAVNVVKINSDGSRTGYNTDYFGFRQSLEQWLPADFRFGAMVLGIGGAAMAVMAVLKDLSIDYMRVSRSAGKGDFTYKQLNEDKALFSKYRLIINTTPLGMAPHTTMRPEIYYECLNTGFYLYDLIYNPAETLFLKEGGLRGANTKNGLEMLELQAEKSWEIWNE